MNFKLSSQQVRRRITHAGVFALVALFAAVISPAEPVHAATFDNRGGWNACYYKYTYADSNATRGYFDNNCRPWDSQPNHNSGYVLPPYNYQPGRRALEPVYNQSTSDGRRNELINLLSSYLNSGDKKKQAGAAFIVHTMLGRNGDQANASGGRNISAADWNNLVQRLNTATFEYSSVNPGLPDSGGTYSSGTYDVAYTWTNAAPSGQYLYIKQNGATKYVLDFECANPIGDMPGLDQVNMWTTDGRSLVGVDHSPNVTSWPYAKPGQTVFWNHRIWNNSGYNMTSNVNWYVDQSGFTYSGSLWRNGSTSPSGASRGGPGNVNSPFVNTGPVEFDTQYVVRDEEVGNTLCQALRWSSSRWDGGSESRQACITIPYDFTLTPRVNDITKAAEPGVSVGPVVPIVENSGVTWSYKDVRWQLSRFVVSGGSTPPGAAQNGSLPCAYYGNGCKPVSDGAQQFVKGDTTVGRQASIVVDDADVGSQLCFALSVQPYSSGSNEWSHSAPECIKIGKKPKLQVWGDDVAVRGDIKASTTKKNDKMFGSWVEYGALSVGTNTQFASGAGLTEQTSDLQRDWSKLTFANNNTPGGAFGLYTASSSVFRPQPLIAQYFSTGKPTAPYDKARSMDENAFATGDSVIVRTTDNLDLAAGTLPKGRSLIIVASGTVTIKGNLDYANGAMTSVRNIPQLVIIADKIDIEGGVTNVDAWLVTSNPTTGVIDTCGDVDGNLSGAVNNPCGKQLTVNGPVLAGKLHLRRTAGSGTGLQSGDPAELFNTRPDAHLWAQLVAASSGRAETVDVVELPPRF